MHERMPAIAYDFHKAQAKALRAAAVADLFKRVADLLLRRGARPDRPGRVAPALPPLGR